MLTRRGFFGMVAALVVARWRRRDDRRVVTARTLDDAAFWA